MRKKEKEKKKTEIAIGNELLRGNKALGCPIERGNGQRGSSWGPSLEGRRKEDKKKIERKER